MPRSFTEWFLLFQHDLSRDIKLLIIPGPPFSCAFFQQSTGFFSSAFSRLVLPALFQVFQSVSCNIHNPQASFLQLSLRCWYCYKVIPSRAFTSSSWGYGSLSLSSALCILLPSVRFLAICWSVKTRGHGFPWAILCSFMGHCKVDVASSNYSASGILHLLVEAPSF